MAKQYQLKKKESNLLAIGYTLLGLDLSNIHFLSY
jgi:hypothetical protein